MQAIASHKKNIDDVDKVKDKSDTRNSLNKGLEMKYLTPNRVFCIHFMLV